MAEGRRRWRHADRHETGAEQGPPEPVNFAHRPEQAATANEKTRSDSRNGFPACRLPRGAPDDGPFSDIAPFTRTHLMQSRSDS